MLITWSRHGRAAVSRADPDKLVHYFNAPAWPKTIAGRHVVVTRDPAPEVLMGDARRFRTIARSVPFKRQYASAVLSFAPGDIDIIAFNAGDPAARHAAGVALHLVLETLLPGLPLTHRPAVHATTHTHTGRLEINLAIACGVFDAHGILRSFNPAPPLKGHRNGLEACRDTLNARFGWADPQDPLRQRLVARPHWEAKATREAQRAHITLPPTPREDLLQDLVAVLVEQDPKSRADVLRAVALSASHTGYILIRTTPNTITLASPDVPDHAITFSGPLFAADFSGLPDEAALAQARRRREDTLAGAPARLREAISRHAGYNADRYAHPPEPDAVNRLERLLDPDWDLPRLIPACHPAHLSSSPARPAVPTERPSHVAHPHPPRTPSARTPPVPRRDHRSTPADPRPGAFDPAGAAGHIADLHRAFDRLARSTPAGSRADLTARLARGLRHSTITARLRWCVTPAGEGIDIQTDHAGLAVWVPDTGLWSNDPDQAARIITVLRAVFPDQTVGSLHLTQHQASRDMITDMQGASP